MGNVVDCIIDFIYPRRCPICGEIVIPKGNKICKGCKEQLIYVKEPCCKKCSKPIWLEEAEFCFDCTKKKLSYDRGYSLLEYNKAMKHSMSEFKFHSKKEYADFYIEEMLEKRGSWIREIAPTALIPVPLHLEKKKQRGYNQAEILANGIGEALDIPVLTNVLLRNKNTTPQKLLDDKERYKNLQHAFVISDEYFNTKNLLSLERVLLIDDIYTTGTTIDVCSRVLKEIGVVEVYFMTVCIGKGY